MKATDSQLCMRWLWRFRFLMLLIIITISDTLLCSVPIRAVSRSFLAKKKKKKKKKKMTREAETTIFSTGTNKMFPTGKLHLLKKILSGASICSIILKPADMMILDFMLFSLKSFCIFCSWHLRICALGNQGLAFLLWLLLPGLASCVFHSLISIQEFVCLCVGGGCCCCGFVLCIGMTQMGSRATVVTELVTKVVALHTEKLNRYTCDMFWRSGGHGPHQHVRAHHKPVLFSHKLQIWLVTSWSKTKAHNANWNRLAWWSTV